MDTTLVVAIVEYGRGDAKILERFQQSSKSARAV